MNFLKNIFTTKSEPIKTYWEFWNWFKENEKDFFSVVKNRKNIEKDFFDKLSSRLAELKDGYFYLAGMYDDNTVELILTADGNTRNIVFVEELVDASPEIVGWKFTALKPSLKKEDAKIEMDGLRFNFENLSFYSNDLEGYPDEIDITIVHNDLTEENKAKITNGIYIYLDNYLGELDFLNNIDNLEIIGRSEAQKELIPIAKLKDFLTWRQKEFIEKYEGIRYNTEEDTYSILEAELEGGNMLLAVINIELLNWDSKASHPWIAVLTIKYDGSKRNGMPGDDDYNLMNTIEDEITAELKGIDGYLNIGRQTANGKRNIYFACKDFRKPSKVFYIKQQDYSKQFEMEYEIYKDKYWQSFERFNSVS
ncbi:MAG: DUF695 domain-containing protein [Bacteroidota bacterium]